MAETGQLIEKAIEAREYSYCKYSGFAVGAAVLTAEGKIFTGVNVENVSYPVTCCAERSAIYSAVSAGCRNFTAIAVAGGPKGKAPEQHITPCGMCRQALAEFNPDMDIYCAKTSTDYIKLNLREILAHGFAGTGNM